MDLWTVAAIVMLVVWGVASFAVTAPGWLQILLTIGVFLVIWRQIVRGTPAPVASADGRAAPRGDRDHAPRG